MSTTENKIEKHEQNKDGDRAVAGKPITDKADNATSQVEKDRLASKALRFTTENDQAFTLVTDKGDVQDKRKIASADIPAPVEGSLKLQAEAKPAAGPDKQDRLDLQVSNEKWQLPTDQFPKSTDKMQIVHLHKNEDGTDYQTTTKEGKVNHVDYPKPPGGSSDVEYGPDGKPKAVHVHNSDGSETSYEKDANGQWHKKQKVFGMTTSDETLPPGADVKVQQESDKNPGQIDVSWGYPIGGSMHHDGYATNGRAQHEEIPPARPEFPQAAVQERVLSSTVDSPANVIADEIRNKLNQWGGSETEWSTGCHECGMLLNQLKSNSAKFNEVINLLRKDKNFVIDNGPPLRVSHHTGHGDMQIWPINP